MTDSYNQRIQKKELESFIFNKITELVDGIDNKRMFINERLVFDESISLYSDDIPEDGEMVNNVSVELQTNEKGRLTRMAIEMGFYYDEI